MPHPFHPFALSEEQEQYRNPGHSSQPKPFHPEDHEIDRFSDDGNPNHKEE